MDLSLQSFSTFDLFYYLKKDALCIANEVSVLCNQQMWRHLGQS